MFVDRFMNTAMHYPCNYGYPAVIRCRPLGLLRMTDEAGPVSKILAVSIDKLCSLYRQMQRPEDMPPLLLAQIAHFFRALQRPWTE